MGSWYGGGHPGLWEGSNKPLLVDIFGLPANRTFAIHDGSAHLLGCSYGKLPKAGSVAFALGTGVAFGFSDNSGYIFDRSTSDGARFHQLHGVSISGAPYDGIWRNWLKFVDQCPQADAIMGKEFAGTPDPWRRPWVSLVLGSRGLELAKAIFECSGAPRSSVPNGEQPTEASDTYPSGLRAYASQWSHFVHAVFLPAFMSFGEKLRPQRVCFAGGIVEHNWPVLREELMRYESYESHKAHGSHLAQVHSSVPIFTSAPAGSGLFGASIYALAGIGGGDAGLWSR